MFKILLKTLILSVIICEIGYAENTARVIDSNTKDFRVDANGNSVLWKVVEKDISVTSKSEKGGRKLTIVRTGSDSVEKVFAEELNGKLSVSRIERTPQVLVVLSDVKAVPFANQIQECSDLVENKLKTFSSELSTFELKKKIRKTYSKSCQNIPEFESISRGVQDAFLDVLKVDEKKSNPLVQCLEKIELQSKSPEIKLLTLQSKSVVADLYNGSLPDNMLKCSKSGVDSITSGEDGSVKIGIGDLKSFDPPEKLRNGVQIAILSSFGLSTEVAKKVSESCLSENYGKASFEILSSYSAAKGKDWEASYSSEKMTQSADTVSAKIASNSELAGINKKLAETKVTIPTAEETSPMALAAIERTQGPEAAQRVARSQSSSLMNAANTVLGAVSSPAVASSRSLASNNASSNRESIKFGESVVGKRLPASAVKARGIASDETIVEEIDLSKRSRNTAAAARAKATTSAANSRSPASSNGGSNVEATALSDDGGQELGRAGSGAGPSAAGSGGSRGSLLSENSSPAGQQAQARSASRAGGATASPAREEIVSYFRNADYTQARRKLRDPNFIKILKDNSITVMDLAGNSFGATRGSTIFLDQGDRFVRQK